MNPDTPFENAITMLANHGMSEEDARNWVEWRGIARARVLLRKHRCCRGLPPNEQYRCKGKMK